MWAILALVTALVVMALIWVLTQRNQPDDPAPPAATGGPSPTATATSTGTSTGTPAPPDGDPVAAAREALAALPAASTCADVPGDVQVFTDFAAAAAPEGAWQDPADADVVVSALTGLQDSCGPLHAVAVSDQLVGGESPSPAVVSAVSAAGDWVVPARPVPPGAQERTSFVSPSGNIACTIGEQSAVCTIAERTFETPATCADGPVTALVSVAGEARPDCSVPAATGNGTLGYGQAAAAGRFACTSEESGVSCWSILSGHGFTLARAGLETF
jgi:hypothetical protein